MAGGERASMTELLKQIAAGVVASILTLLIVAISGGITDGGLIRFLNGATQAELKATQDDLAAIQAELVTAQARLATVHGTPIPEGAVVAFDTPNGCPNGWSDLSDAIGKVIIGAGGPGERYAYRVAGGEEDIVLTERHIPAHAHGYTDTYFSESDSKRPRGSQGVSVPEDRGHAGRVDADNVGWAVTRSTGSFGHEGDNPVWHTNMQPYVALHFCVFKPSADS